MNTNRKWSVNVENLFDFVNDKIKDGAITKANAFREYCESYSLPEHVVRNTYYKVAKDRGFSQPDYPLITLVPDISEEVDTIEMEQQDSLSVLSEIINLSEQTGVRVEPLFEALLPLFRGLVANNKEDLQKRYDILADELVMFKREREETEKHVESINIIFSEFMKLPSLKKIGNLEQFCYDVKAILEKI
jgi:hypothetical protein